MTLAEIQRLFSEYYVIGIHMRLGDAVAFQGKQGSISHADRSRTLRAFHCAETVESYASGLSKRLEYETVDADGPILVKGKKVFWFLASDSQWFGSFAQSSISHCQN